MGVGGVGGTHHDASITNWSCGSGWVVMGVMGMGGVGGTHRDATITNWSCGSGCDGCGWGGWYSP